MFILEREGGTGIHTRRTTHQERYGPLGLRHFITDCSSTLSGASRAVHNDGTPVGGPITLSCADSAMSAGTCNSVLWPISVPGSLHVSSRRFANCMTALYQLKDVSQCRHGHLATLYQIKRRCSVDSFTMALNHFRILYVTQTAFLLSDNFQRYTYQFKNTWI